MEDSKLVDGSSSVAPIFPLGTMNYNSSPDSLPTSI